MTYTVFQPHMSPPRGDTNRASLLPDDYPPDNSPEYPRPSRPDGPPVDRGSTRMPHLSTPRPYKRTAAEADLAQLDEQEPADDAPLDLLGHDLDLELDEVAIDEDDAIEPTRFDVEADDASDMPRVGEEVLEPFQTRSSPETRKPRHGSTLMMVIVDTSGIHELPVVFCGCPNAPTRDIQLLRMGLYPATSRRPQTAFTFRLLDDHLLTNKECKIPALSYYSRLRRITSETFPHMVPVSFTILGATRRHGLSSPHTGSLP